MARSVEAGGNPLDCWSAEWSFGYPVLRTYQPLAHLLVVALYFAFGKTISLMTLFLWVRFLSVALLPASFFVSARWLGLSRLTAAAAAVLAPLVSTNLLYGVEFGSFTWAGSGLFPQAVATHLLLLSLGAGWMAVRSRPPCRVSGVLVGLTVLSHLIYGYIAALSLAATRAASRCALSARGADAPDAGDRGRGVRDRGISIDTAARATLRSSITAAGSPSGNGIRSGPGRRCSACLPGNCSTTDACRSSRLLACARRRAPALEPAARARVQRRARIHRGRRGPLDPALFRPAVLGTAADVLGGFRRHASAPRHRRRADFSRAAGGNRSRGGVAGVGAAPAFGGRDRRNGPAALSDGSRARAVSGEQRRVGTPQSRKLCRGASERSMRSIARAKQRGGRAYAGLAATWGGRFKVGDVPFYAFLSTAQVPAVGFLYHAMALTGDIMVRFNDRDPTQYRLFNIQYRDCARRLAADRHRA